MTDQKKLFFAVQSYYFALQDSLKKYKMAGINPPEYLLENFKDAKRQLEIVSESLE